MLYLDVYFAKIFRVNIVQKYNKIKWCGRGAEKDFKFFFTDQNIKYIFRVLTSTSKLGLAGT
jgi:hypothetical protein